MALYDTTYGYKRYPEPIKSSTKPFAKVAKLYQLAGNVLRRFGDYIFDFEDEIDEDSKTGANVTKKKEPQPYNGSLFDKRYDGQQFSDKKQGRLPGTDRATFIRNDGAENHGVFTVEDERSKLRNDEQEPDRYSTPIERHSSPGEEYDQNSPSYEYYENKQIKPVAGTRVNKVDLNDELDDDMEAHFKELHSGYNSKNGVYTPDDPVLPAVAALGRSSQTGSYKSLLHSEPSSPVHRKGFLETPPPAFSPAPAIESPHPIEDTHPSRSQTRNLSRNSLFDDNPMHLPAATAIIPVQASHIDHSKEAWQAPIKSTVNVAPVEEPIKMFDIFLVTEDGVTNQHKGKVPLMPGIPMTLTHLRSALKNSPDDSVRWLAQKEYKFLTEDSRPIELPEGALLVENLYPSNEIYVQKIDDDWQAPKKKKNAFVSEPSVRAYAVYKYRPDRGVKECIGDIPLPDNVPMTLTHLRGILAKSDLETKELKSTDYVFLTETFDDISAPEGALLVDLLYPNQEIVFRLFGDKPSSRDPKIQQVPPRIGNGKRKELAYVGPMGMCTAAECEKPARIKCLDCGQVGYCTTRHMRLDVALHRKVCFKPMWKS